MSHSVPGRHTGLFLHVLLNFIHLMKSNRKFNYHLLFVIMLFRGKSKSLDHFFQSLSLKVMSFVF